MASLGDGPSGKLRLFFVSYLGWARWPPGRSVRLDLRALGRSFSCLIDDYTQLLVIREVFLDEDYRIDDGFSPATVVDLGSNIGASIIYFRLRYPKARIIGFEPDPAVFATLRRNVAPFEGIHVVNAALAASCGETVFFRYPHHSWASSLVPLWGTSATKVTVQTTTMDNVLEDFELAWVDLLKIDIEGGEWEVLPGFRQLHKVRTVVGELHRIGNESPEHLLETLHDFRVSVTLASEHIVRFLATRG
jgi:FkbM family methyltransferase